MQVEIKNIIIFLLISITFTAHAQAQDVTHEQSKSAQQPLIRLLAGKFEPLSEAAPVLLPGEKIQAYSADETGYYIVQFIGPILPSDKQELITEGAEVFDYVPDYAFIVKMNNAIRNAAQDIERVRWIGIYQPDFRIHPDLANLALTAISQVPDAPVAVRQDIPIDINVSVFAVEDMNAISLQIKKLGGTVTGQSQGTWGGMLEVTIAPSLLVALSGISGVSWIEKAPVWASMNDVAMGIMNVRQAWEPSWLTQDLIRNGSGLHGNGQTVAVTDTGIDAGVNNVANLHDDFEDGSGNSRILQIDDRVGDGAADVAPGIDPSGCNRRGAAHGTHVAGSVLGNGDLSGADPANHDYPVNSRTGTAPEANLVFQAVADNTCGALTGIPGDITDLFRDAMDDGASLHNNSWGDTNNQGNYSAHSRQADEFVWNNTDYTILFCAMNEGIDSDSNGVVDGGSVTAPSTAKNVISVGASENDRPGQANTYGVGFPGDFLVNPINTDRMADDTDGLAAFSGRGPVDDGRIKPDLVAPGTFIASTRSSQGGTGWGVIDANYIFNGGTSMATPLTTGAATIVRQFFTDWRNTIPSAALIKAILINGAEDINPGQYGTGATREIPRARPTNVAGWGRVDLENSIFPNPPRSVSVVDQKTGLSTGDLHTYGFYNVSDSSQPFSVSLVWSDFRGTLASGGALVNDVDLFVQDSTGNTYRQINAISNVVGIDIQIPATGLYTIVVKGFNIPNGPQKYALVVSGIMNGDVFANGNSTGFEDGSSTNPFNTVSEAVNAVPGSGGELHITSNSYNERLVIDKKVTLLAVGGMVVIGAP
ncbi:MAG: S8 family serine peptidase [Planctomycetes bacterium]|nr:S8 family serine peptidase [Planctomycetota bacterium]